MKAWITKRFGEYALVFRSKDLPELRQIVNLVEDHIDVKIEDLV